MSFKHGSKGSQWYPREMCKRQGSHIHEFRDYTVILVGYQLLVQVPVVWG